MTEKQQPDLEGMLIQQIAGRGLPAPALQSRLPWQHTKRLFRADLLWPEQRLLVEVDGGTFSGRSRHTTGEGYERDTVKQNIAVLDGWRYFRVTSRQVRDGSALSWIAAALGLGETQAGFSPPRKRKRKKAPAKPRSVPQ